MAKRAVEGFNVPLFYRLELGDAGVDEQDVKPLERPANGVRNFLLSCCVTRIGRDNQHVAPELFARSLQSGWILTGDRHSRTFS